MVKLIGFDTREELSELTVRGYAAQDTNTGRLAEEPDWYNEGTCLTDPELPLWWLMSQMENYCVGFSHTEYNGMHYYLVHHA